MYKLKLIRPTVLSVCTTQLYLLCGSSGFSLPGRTERKETRKGHKIKRKKMKSHMTLWRILMSKTNIHRRRVVHYAIEQVKIVGGFIIGWCFWYCLVVWVKVSGWFSIRAFRLLPLVYWDATGQEGKRTSPVEMSHCYVCAKQELYRTEPHLFNEWSETCDIAFTNVHTFCNVSIIRYILVWYINSLSRI